MDSKQIVKKTVGPFTSCLTLTAILHSRVITYDKKQSAPS